MIKTRLTSARAILFLSPAGERHEQLTFPATLAQLAGHLVATEARQTEIQ